MTEMKDAGYARLRRSEGKQLLEIGVGVSGSEVTGIVAQYVGPRTVAIDPLIVWAGTEDDRVTKVPVFVTGDRAGDIHIGLVPGIRSAA